MDKYKISETVSFGDQLVKITKSSLSLVGKKLENYIYPQLRSNPFFGPNIARLKDWDPPTWRYRMGDWRFFYQISEKEKNVYMIAIYHRREAYRK